MKKFRLKWKAILVIAMMSVCVVSCGDDEETLPQDGNESASTETSTMTEENLIVKVEKAGTFESLVSEEKRYSAQKLKVSGPLNGDDIRCLRNMMMTTKGGRLESLDMSDASIVSGGAPYISNNNSETTYITQHNIISESMFEDCDALKVLVLPNSVVRISHYMFGYGFQSNIRKITIGRLIVGSIEHDDDQVLGVLAWMDKLEEIKVHADNSVYASEDGVMYDKEKTVLLNVPSKYSRNLSFPNSVNTIAGYAFRGVSTSSVKLPGSVKKLDDSAFSNSDIKRIDIGSVSDIGNSVFYGCDKTDEIVLSETLTWIPDDTFRGCESLSNITIPQSVRLIGQYAFHSCKKLCNIYMEGSTPPSATSDVKNTDDVFTILDAKSINLYVPKGSKANYASKIPWSGLNIIEQ